MNKTKRAGKRPPPGGWGRRTMDRAGIQRRTEVMAASGWSTALEQYARATGMAVTLLDSELKVVAGPFTPGRMGEMLSGAGCWGAAGPCLEAERELVSRCMETSAVVHGRGLECFALFAVPARLDGVPIGAVVGGWVPDTPEYAQHLPQLASRLPVPADGLSQALAADSPTTHQKLQTYADLLQTLTDSIVRERCETIHEQEQARELLAINESARQLASADGVAEIGAAVVRAAMALAHANGARLLIADRAADPPRQEQKNRFPVHWKTVASHGFDAPDALPVGDEERRELTSRLSVPIDAADGSVIGLIETTEINDLPQPRRRTQMSALAAQASVALQKALLIDDLQRQRTSLEEANRAKDEFLAVLSHELRTPLTPILGWVSILRQGPGLVEGSLETLNSALAAIERNARQELHLVDEMLDLSRILNHKVHLKPEPVPPGEALEAALSDAAVLVGGRDLQLQLAVAPDLPPVAADPKRLHQILANLLSNAVKFTPDGGQITLGASPAEAAVQFCVKDNGAGIPKATLPHIFERFRQADSSATRRYGGLGIGLSVVRGLVELHGGTITAQSEGEGAGACFTFTLPVDAPLPQDAVSGAGQQ